MPNKINPINTENKTKFNISNYKQIVNDSLRHAKESHCYFENDLLELWNEGAKSPSNAMIYLHSETKLYNDNLNANLSKDDFMNKLRIINQNFENTQKKLADSNEYKKFIEAIQTMYNKTWPLRMALILTGRYDNNFPMRKLPKILKMHFKKFMPQNIEKKLAKEVKKKLKF